MVTTTSDPSTKNKTRNWDYEEYNEADFERKAENSFDNKDEKVETFSQGSIAFNSTSETIIEMPLAQDIPSPEIPNVFLKAFKETPRVASATVHTLGTLTEDTFDAAKDLTKQLFGFPERGSASEPMTEAAFQAQQEEAQELKVAREIKFRTDFFQDLINAQSQEEIQTLMKEALRMTGQADVGDIAKQEGYLDKNAIATLAGIGNKQEEVQEQVEDKQKSDSKTQVDGFVMKEGEMFQGIEKTHWSNVAG